MPYLITDQERKAFKALATDEERENFIEQFWRRRDPNPDTEENEFREQYYERIAYANEHFTSGIPGWKTDRGRIYIAWENLTLLSRIRQAALIIVRAMRAAAIQPPILLRSGFTDTSRE